MTLMIDVCGDDKRPLQAVATVFKVNRKGQVQCMVSVLNTPVDR